MSMDGELSWCITTGYPFQTGAKQLPPKILHTLLPSAGLMQTSTVTSEAMCEDAGDTGGKEMSLGPWITVWRGVILEEKLHPIIVATGMQLVC